MAKRVKTTTSPTRAGAKSSRALLVTSTVYKDFAIYTGEKAPAWHPIRKMRYIFFRMIGGITITDAIDEIHWSAAEFWHLVDLKRHGPFREEYKRAKTLQGRSFSDSVVTIAEGRDAITRSHAKRIHRLITKSLHKIARQKNPMQAKLLLVQLMSDLREHDKIVITRNKLQMDAAKWIAKTTNPSEFGDKVALGAPATPDGDGTLRPLLVQFVAPDGSVVPL